MRTNRLAQSTCIRERSWINQEYAKKETIGVFLEAGWFDSQALEAHLVFAVQRLVQCFQFRQRQGFEGRIH